MDIANFDALKAQGKILDLANVNQDEDYLLIGKYNNKYNTDSFKYTKYPVYAIKAKDLIAVATDGVTILGDGTPGSPLTTAAATAVQSVTGLDTDNTDPLNPVVNIAVDGITITGQGTPASPLVANPASQFQYEIGQYVMAQGGVIAHRWLSTSAEGSPTAGTVQNYLVVDTTDLSIGASWDNGIFANIPNVESTWDGKTNTNNLIAAGAGGGITAGTAAVLCDASSNNGKTDWYLPAIDELNKVWINRWDIAQGITAASGTQLAFNIYWSSTEFASTDAWFFTFYDGLANYSDKYSNYYVRAMRKFSI